MVCVFVNAPENQGLIPYHHTNDTKMECNASLTMYFKVQIKGE